MGVGGMEGGSGVARAVGVCGMDGGALRVRVRALPPRTRTDRVRGSPELWECVGGGEGKSGSGWPELWVSVCVWGEGRALRVRVRGSGAPPPKPEPEPEPKLIGFGFGVRAKRVRALHTPNPNPN